MGSNGNKIKRKNEMISGGGHKMSASLFIFAAIN
jgi:hypothetical protein